MSAKILAAVEEVKAAGLVVKKLGAKCDDLAAAAIEANTQYHDGLQAFREAERKLKGIIFEETQQ